ncbi:cupin domain-containing protein [Nonomuraea sp. NBC_00507]|uniref:cupin domain-containing protein n=1 Tax=Nonomuraea sp. NBC_00507 TaxID=2976002 RepID=UPI002E18C59F
MSEQETRETTTAGALTDLADLRPLRIWQDVTARVLQCERITMAVVEIPAGGLVPAHQHENEQVGLCLAGSLTFTVGEETRDLGPGGMWRILSNVPHVVKAGPRGAVVVEVFSPVRSDWADLEEAPDAPLSWPATT